MHFSVLLGSSLISCQELTKAAGAAEKPFQEITPLDRGKSIMKKYKSIISSESDLVKVFDVNCAVADNKLCDIFLHFWENISLKAFLFQLLHVLNV